MSARDDILAGVRKALRGQAQASDAAPVDERLVARPRGPQPDWPEDPLARFVAQAERAAATVTVVQGAHALPAAAAAYLEAAGLSRTLALAPDPGLQELAWTDALSPVPAHEAGGCPTVLTRALGGVAETGSLVMGSGPSTPASMNFLPESFLCVLEQARIVRHMEALWPQLRALPGGLPRSVHLITGPSRTADVEQVVQLGAHGPRRVHVLLLVGRLS